VEGRARGGDEHPEIRSNEYAPHGLGWRFAGLPTPGLEYPAPKGISSEVDSKSGGASPETGAVSDTADRGGMGGCAVSARVRNDRCSRRPRFVGTTTSIPRWTSAAGVSNAASCGNDRAGNRYLGESSREWAGQLMLWRAPRFNHVFPHRVIGKRY
jgi:hypothetical protein